MPQSEIEYYKTWGLFRDLLFNNIVDLKNNELVNSFKKCNEVQISVMVIVIDNYYSMIKDREDYENRDIRFSTYAAIDKGISHKCLTLPIAIEDNVFAALLQTNQSVAESHVEDALEIGLFLKGYVKQNIGLSISIGIGRAYNKLEDLVNSYKEALSALEHRFYLGNDQVVLAENIVPFANDINFLTQEKHSQLLTKTMTCDLDFAFWIIDELLEETSKKSINPLLAKIRFIDSLIDIINQSDLHNKEDLSLTINELSSLIFKTDNVSELKNQLRLAINEIVNAIKLRRKKTNREVFESAAKYIQVNFHKNISLEDVAKHVYISPYYFCHGFKEYMGISFIEYLKKVRIEEAKKLLMNTDMSINKICTRVGYSDPHYFSKVFKSVMGVTPGSFCVNRATNKFNLTQS